MFLDKVSEELDIYIGGLFTLRRRQALAEAKITHILSVLRLPLEKELFSPYEHMVIEVDDVEDENLLQYFPSTNDFIQKGLDSGGKVLVHCAMGKSRSAACVIAYLVRRYKISPLEALSQIQLARPICEPNQGFMDQLNLFHEIEAPDNLEDNLVYQRWVYKHEIALSNACGLAPDTDKIRFEDEHIATENEPNFELRCRKCRRVLATSNFIINHKTSHYTSNQVQDSDIQPDQSCAHIFIDALSWMRPELEQGKLDGRLECPKCRQNVGKYAWQGMKCSCAVWVVPAITLSRGRVDEMKTKNGLAGVRHPPNLEAIMSSTNKRSSPNL